MFTKKHFTTQLVFTISTFKMAGYLLRLDNMATPKSVFVQDKPVAVYNFPTNVHNDDVAEINEVKAALLVKSLFPSLGAPKCPQ